VPRLDRVRLRLDTALTRWGEGPDPIVYLHGFLDSAATFQFVVDAFAKDRSLLAPDLRGFGRSARSGQDAYWFPDYLGDLEALLDHERLERATLIGHSLGGNLAMLYAGLRPERVARVVNLEGMGLPATHPAEAPGRYAKWLDELKEDKGFAIHASLEAFTDVIRKRNPRLTAERADFIARAWAEVLPDGRARVNADPAHRRVNPVLYRREEAEASWRGIRAPVLLVTGADSPFAARLPPGDLPFGLPPGQLMTARLEGCGHMLHHEDPVSLAGVIEAFLDA
jgi:pimeloyl-ACP methyl ester carboxylesterase